MKAPRALLLPHTPSSVAVARQRLAQELLSRRIPEWAVEDAALVVSELMANALRHARPLRSNRVRVSWRLCPERLQIAVSDGGSTTTPRRSRRSPSALGGRGLGIVEHVAEDWGVHHDSDATTVWASLSMPEPADVVPLT